MNTKTRGSNDNVFRGLGPSNDEAQNLEIRSDLMIRLIMVIDAGGLAQKEAEALLEVSQPQISDLVRGKMDRFSIDTLVAMLGRARVRIASIVGRASNVASSRPVSARRRGTVRAPAGYWT